MYICGSVLLNIFYVLRAWLFWALNFLSPSDRHRSTPVSTILQKLVRFFIFNIIHFQYKKAVLVETERLNNPPICNVRRMEPANKYPVQMTQKPRKGTGKIQKVFPGEHAPRPPRSFGLSRSFRKLVIIYPRSVPVWWILGVNKKIIGDKYIFIKVVWICFWNSCMWKK